MPSALRKAASVRARSGFGSVHTDIRRIPPRGVVASATPCESSAGESAGFREAIAYMRGVADAMSTQRPEAMDASPASAPPSTQGRRITLPYLGIPANQAEGSDEPSTFEGDAEQGSGVRFRVAAPCAELYELAGLDRAEGS